MGISSFPFPFAVTWFISIVSTPLFARLAPVMGLIDRPGELKTHGREVPYGGGLAMALGIGVGVPLSASFIMGGIPDNLLAVLTGAAPIFLLGIVDDRRPFGPAPKLVVQTASALLLVEFGIRLTVAALPDWLNILLTVVWIVGMTNAFNIIDIMDGLAAGVAAIASLTFALVAGSTGDATLAILCTSITGAALGFLPYNFTPARVFMGDAGSQTLGFLLASAAVMGSYTTWNDIALFAPVLVLGIPIYDTALVSALRIRAGISPLKGTPDHFAIRLRKFGFSTKRTVLVAYLSSMFLSLLAVAVTMVEIEGAVAIYLLAGISALTGGVILSRAG